MDQQNGASPVHLGRLTYTDLASTEDFFLPPQADAWGVTRAPFSRHIARMSAELAADGYELDIKPWITAGWDDCTFLVEDKLIVLDPESDSRLSALEGEWKRHRAKAMIHGVNPFGDLLRAVRQLLVTDMGKTIVMTRALPSGKVVIGISFIGTTSKYYDWFTNFKFQRDTGMHNGFLSLARQFEAQAPRILLPKLASAIGEETYTLADVILEAQKPDSRYCFWISGHSQGGAIAQTYTHLLMEMGIPCTCIHAYTYAAPSVAAGDGSIDPKVYPVYNIVNADDMVPRIGAQVRLGQDRVYYPSNAFRKRHYRVEEDMEEAYDRVRYLAGQVQTTEEAICWGIAFMQMMQDMHSDEDLEALFMELIPHLTVLKRMNLGAVEVAEFFRDKLASQLKGLTGMDADDNLCSAYMVAMRDMLETFDAKMISKTLLHGLSAPHRMRPDKHDEAYESPYIAIARRHLDSCFEGVWMPEMPPRCVDEAGDTLLPMHHVRPLALLASEVALIPAPRQNTLPPETAMLIEDTINKAQEEENDEPNAT